MRTDDGDAVDDEVLVAACDVDCAAVALLVHALLDVGVDELLLARVDVTDTEHVDVVVLACVLDTVVEVVLVAKEVGDIVLDTVIVFDGDVATDCVRVTFGDRDGTDVEVLVTDILVVTAAVEVTDA